MKRGILGELENRVLVFDGAMGSQLMKKGLKKGMCPELFNIEKPQTIKEVHRSYIEAGADVIITNTFGGNRLKLAGYGLADKVGEINEAAVHIAKMSDRIYVVGDVGPLGELIKPLGSLDYEEAISIFEEQIFHLVKAGVDGIIIETMVDIKEIKAAIIAARRVSKNIPLIAQMTLDMDGRTVNGADVKTVINILDGLPADVIGFNCSVGPDRMKDFVKEALTLTNKYITAQANAGLPKLVDGQMVYDMDVDFYVENALKMVEYGVNMIGGCCGTTPEYIRKIKAGVVGKEPVDRHVEKRVMISSPRQTFVRDDSNPFIVVGERINPSARKKVKASILTHDISYIKQEAMWQIDSGASLIDVNVGVGGRDEISDMMWLVNEIDSSFNIPLSIDSSDDKVIERVLFEYPGRPLINSITCEEERLERMLPILSNYKPYIIVLPIDEDGIPEDIEKRRSIIEKAVWYFTKYGIEKELIFIDILAMSLGASQEMARVSLDSIKLAKSLGLNTIVGLSNISFGLPQRGLVNRTFLTMGLAFGLDAAILNPLDSGIMDTISAWKVIAEYDKNAISYIDRFSKKAEEGEKKVVDSKVVKKDLPIDRMIYQAIMIGDRDNIAKYVKQAIDEGWSASAIMDDIMIKAIREVGDKYERKEYFLPQLVIAAETMKKGFSVIEPLIKNTGDVKKSGKVIFATVKGDVHDIGKNIVVIMLQNYGFEVVDLGKDIDIEDIIKAVREYKPDILGLSALMTTTMTEMSRVVNRLREEGIEIPVMIGGAAVSKEYAKEIGAYYSSDANEAVKVALNIMKSKEGSND